MKHHTNQNGYIALISMLIVAGVTLTISIAVSLRSIEELQMSFSTSQAARSTSLSDACLEEGLNRLRKNWSSYSGSLSIDGNLCIINTVVNNGTASVEAIGTIDIYQQKSYIEINRVDNALEVTNWQHY
ncbi:hypothetical protein KKA15_03755 [Patescibacteria group bacterium]|nr:hypothetical protein [Patescibacteria group bacterium]